MSISEARLAAWNVQAPSALRASQQVDWLIAKDLPDVLVLSELRGAGGKTVWIDRLRDLDYAVFSHEDASRSQKRCVLIASRVVGTRACCGGRQCSNQSVSFPERLVAIQLTLLGRSLHLVGAYVPSRGSRDRRNLDKRKFQSEMSDYLRSLRLAPCYDTVVLGDLNVVDRADLPHYSNFRGWEHDFYRSFASYGLVDVWRQTHRGEFGFTWFGRSGRGYRFDYGFVSEDMAPMIESATYDLQCISDKVSDHALLTLRMVRPEDPSVSGCYEAIS